MRALLILLVACKKDAPPPPAAPTSDCTLAPAPRSALDGGAFALLARCTPCGVAWDPLVAASNYDTDAPPTDLPDAPKIFAVLDACKHTCESSARSQLSDELRPSEYAGAPAAAWKDLAARCPGALALDDHTRRFARGSWYALGEVARALPAGAAVELPLPPLTAASTAVALPRSDALAPWHPRVQITIGDPALFVGVLPWVRVAAGEPLALVPGPGLDYPGEAVTEDQVSDALGKVAAALAGSTHDADKEADAVLIAPRAMPIARVLDVLGHLPARAWLAATPASHEGSAWPSPLGAIACSVGKGDPMAGMPSIDLSKPGAPIATRVTSAPLPDGATIVHVALPATAQVDDLAAALTALAGRKVDTAIVSLSP